MSGVLPTTNGLLPTPLATAHNTLDDGAGNATIGGALTAGATVGSHADALVASGGGQSFHVQPLAGTGSYNPITVNGDVAVVGSGSIEGGAALALAPWSNTRSGLRLLPSGAVLSPANTLDDGSGNATIAGALSVEGAQSGSTLNLSSGATVGGALSVTGAQSGSTLSLSGNATIAGALTPYAIGARGFVYDIRVAGVPVDGTTDATAALNALFTDGIAAEFFFPAGTTVLVAGTVTLPDAPITCRGVYGLSQIQFTGSGQFLSDNANSPSGVHPQHKFEGINFVVGGSVPALEYNWSVYSQPITTGAQEASIVFRDCGFFATTARVTRRSPAA